MNIIDRFRALFRSRPGESRVYIPQHQGGVLVTEDTAMTLPEWWACVSVISRTVATLPWGVFERTPNGRKLLDGGVSWLLNSQPNPEMTAVSFREALIAHVLNWGNGYAEIQKDLAGRPTALWLMTPDRVCPERDARTGSLRYRVSQPDGQTVFLEPSQVLHVHGLGFDGLVGYSIVQMARRSIGIGIAQDTFGQAFYANGTAFGGTVEVGAGMSPGQIKEMESYLNGVHQGPNKAFKVRVVPQGSKYHNPDMPLTDAQFVESRGLSITAAARWLGVPPHKIADLSRSTNNNIEHQGIEFVTDAIVPWATRLEQEANIKLFSPRAQGRVYTKLLVNALMRGDAKSRAEFYRTMTQIGAMSINEVRELEEMNGIGEAGDQHLVQLNQTTLERLVAEPADPREPGASTPDPDAADQPAATDQPTNVIRRAALDWWRQQRQA